MCVCVRIVFYRSVAAISQKYTQKIGIFHAYLRDLERSSGDSRDDLYSKHNYNSTMELFWEANYQGRPLLAAYKINAGCAAQSGKGRSLPLLRHPSSMTLTQNGCDTKKTTRVNSRKKMLRRRVVLQTTSTLASCQRQKASLPLVATFHILQTPSCAMVELRRELTAAQVATQGACFNARPDLRRPPKKNAPGPLNPTGRSST